MTSWQGTKWAANSNMLPVSFSMIKVKKGLIIFRRKRLLSLNFWHTNVQYCIFSLKNRERNSVYELWTWLILQFYQGWLWEVHLWKWRLVHLLLEKWENARIWKIYLLWPQKGLSWGICLWLFSWFWHAGLTSRKQLGHSLSGILGKRR